MSRSRLSLIGLPLLRLSATASSRARSCTSRAMRNRYLPRSRPLIFDHVLSCARRAAVTAASTSASLASAMVAMCFSSAGEIVANDVPVPGRNSPSMNRPYSSRRFRIARDSGAGAYSRKLMCVALIDRHVVGAGVVAGGELLPLHEHVVQQARCPIPEE